MRPNIKDFIKDACASLGFRVTNARRRWGIDPLDDILKIVQDANRIRTIFDVGANEGQSAKRFSKTFPRVSITSFEPVSKTYQVLSKNVKHDPRIRPVHSALGSEQGEASITLFGDSGKSSLVGRMDDSLHRVATGTESIQVTTLDNYVKSSNAPHIDFLKIDTEGFDMEVLRGAQDTLKHGGISFILTEFHYLLRSDTEQRLGSLQELASFVTNYGYRYVCSYTDSVHWDEPMGTYNVLFMPSSHHFRFNP